MRSGAREIARADICADHRQRAGAQTERQGIEQIFKTHGDAEACQLHRAQSADETRERGKRQIVENGLERHRRTDAQNLDEQPSVEAHAAQGEPNRSAA